MSVQGGLCPGGGGSLSGRVRETPPYGKEWAVRILLECIFVGLCIVQKLHASLSQNGETVTLIEVSMFSC